MKRKNIYFLCGILLAIVAILVGGSFYMVNYALVNPLKNRDVKSQMDEVREQYPYLCPWLDSLQRSHALRDTFVVTSRGERQHAIFVRDPRADGRTAVLVHGYHRMAVSMLPIGSVYSRMGYNILLPDLHGHGQSDGDDIQMGWKDRRDVMHWMTVAERMFRSSHGASRMVVHGVSMGAATTMCVSGEHQPAYVRCFVEDCGYTSVWDEFHHQLKEQFGLPAFPLLYTADWLCQMKYGWNFKEASPLRQVAKSRQPMLFIHGDKDTYVPFSMLRPLYDAKTKPLSRQGKVEKEMWITAGTEHAESFKDYPEAYARHVKDFVGKYMR